MRTRLTIAAVVVLLIVAGLIAFRAVGAPEEELSQQPANGAAVEGQYVVTETPNGYVPATLTIKAGETVTFKSTTGKPHWPASNLHPSHLIYAEFDPQMPIQPEAAWSFTFDKPGTWQYHDHLAPYFTGTVIVE